jgi:hypothetical protein
VQCVSDNPWRTLRSDENATSASSNPITSKAVRLPAAADSHSPHDGVAAIDHFGGPEALTLHVVRVPAIDSGEVLIALDTAGVGPWDEDMREGWYTGRKPKFPPVLGVDGAGRVAAVGPRVRD